jgi:hypothetical protein
MAKAAKKKPAGKPATKAADGEIVAKRAKAYADLEPFLCNVVNMGTIASNLFDCPDQGLYDFAVNHLEAMLDDLEARYYALDFTP